MASGKLPDSVHVGPYVYELTDDATVYTDTAMRKDECDWGWCQYGLLRLIISPAQAPMHKRVTVLHEVLHAVMALSDQRVDKEEEIVRALAAPLLDMLRRNPALVAYFLEDDHAIDQEGPRDQGSDG